MYVNDPKETWDMTTFDDLGLSSFKPCVIKAKIINISLLTEESARQYFSGARDDLINLINDEGSAELSLYEPMEIFPELVDTFTAGKCVFDGGFFHLKRSIEGTEYQGVSNCPWLGFVPEDVVLVLYNRSQTLPLKDRLIIIGHSKVAGDNDIDKLLSLPPRPGFTGDFYDVYYDAVATEWKNCFLGIRDHYLIKYEVDYADYNMVVNDHGRFKPLVLGGYVDQYKLDYPHGMIMQTDVKLTGFTTAYAGAIFSLSVKWYGPRQFNTLKESLAYLEFDKTITISGIQPYLYTYPFIMTTIHGDLHIRMFDYGTLYYDIRVKRILDADDYCIDVDMYATKIDVDMISTPDGGYIKTWDKVLQSSASGILLSSKYSLVKPDADHYHYSISIYANGDMCQTHTKYSERRSPASSDFDIVSGSWITYIYMDIDADTYVYYITEYYSASSNRSVMYFQQGMKVTELSNSDEGYFEGSADDDAYHMVIEQIGNIDYLCVDYRPTSNRQRIHMCAIEKNDRGDISFLKAPTIAQLRDNELFSYSDRPMYPIIDGKILSMAIDLASFDYLDLNTV